MFYGLIFLVKKRIFNFRQFYFSSFHCCLFRAMSLAEIVQKLQRFFTLQLSISGYFIKIMDGLYKRLKTLSGLFTKAFYESLLIYF